MRWGTTAALVAAACCSLACHAASLPHLAPVNGSYFGVSIDFAEDTVASYTSRLGFEPAAYNLFIPIPLNDSTTAYLETVLPQIAQQQAIAVLTVMPNEGLEAVTEAAVAELASEILAAQQVPTGCQAA